MVKKLVTILMCGIMAFSLVACGSSTEQKSKSNEGTKTEDNQKDSENETKTEEKKEETKEFYAIGEEVKLDNNKLVVNSVEKSAGGEFDKPQDGNEFVIVNVTISNDGDSEISYNPYNFEMQNSQGQIKDQAFTTVNTDTALHDGKLAAGGTVSGTIAFEQPVGDTNLVLKYKADMFNNKEIKVKLN